jgi:DNA uptake protein ComE-like DNA-binding protein
MGTVRRFAFRRPAALLFRAALAMVAIGEMVSAWQEPATGSPAAGNPTVAAQSTRKRAAALVDINHAAVAELETLPGIGEAYAAKIIKNRPYANKTQLSSKGVIPAAAYARIKALIVAKQ